VNFTYFIAFPAELSIYPSFSTLTASSMQLLTFTPYHNYVIPSILS